MCTALVLAALAGGLYALYRVIRTSESDWAKVARVIIWGEDRPR